MRYILGIDAGFTSMGIAVCDTDLNFTCAECFIPDVKRIEKVKLEKKTKKITLSQTEFDTQRIYKISSRIIEVITDYRPDIVIVELPTGGAKSAGAIKGMAMSTALTCATLNVIKHSGIHNFELVRITPIQNKKGATGLDKWHGEGHDEDKWLIFQHVNKQWPNIPWPKKARNPEEYDDAKCWAMADALSCIMTWARMNNHCKIVKDNGIHSIN